MALATAIAPGTAPPVGRFHEVRDGLGEGEVWTTGSRKVPRPGRRGLRGAAGGPSEGWGETRVLHGELRVRPAPVRGPPAARRWWSPGGLGPGPVRRRICLEWEYPG